MSYGKITIAEAHEWLADISSELLLRLERFEAATGLSVDGIDLIHDEPIGGRKRVIAVRTNIDLPVYSTR